MLDDFVIQRDVFLAALKMLERMANKTTIQFTTEQERFVLRSLSTEVGATCISGPGQTGTGKKISLVLPFKVLFDLLRIANAPDFHFNTNTDQQQLTLTGGDLHATLRASLESMPEISFGSAERISFPADRFRKALESVQWCCARENSGRPGLEGVHLEWKDQTLTLVAADGFRLSYTTWNVPIEKQQEMTIPARSIQCLLGVIKDARPETLEIRFTEKGLECEMETGQGLDFQAFLPRIDQPFPDWRSVLAQTKSDKTTGLRIPSTELQVAVKRAIIFAREDQHIPLCLKISPNSMEVSGEDGSVGNSQTQVSLENPTGFEGTLWLNGRFFMDMLEEEIHEDRLNLTVQSSKIPVCSGWEMEGLRNGCLLMPILKEK